MTASEHFNLAETVCRGYPDAVYRIALQEVKFAGINTYTFGGLDYLSDKFATILNCCNIRSGDRMATVLPQSATVAVAHLAALKAGIIVVPLSIRAEKAQIEKLLELSDAKVIIVDESIYQNFADLKERMPEIEAVFVASDFVSRNDFGEGLRSYWYEVNFADSDYAIAETVKTTPAYLFYETDDAGQLHGNICTHGEIIEAHANFGDAMQAKSGKQRVFWTAADWASKQVLIGMLYAAWVQGFAVASYEAADANEALNFFKQAGLNSLEIISENV